MLFNKEGLCYKRKCYKGFFKLNVNVFSCILFVKIYEKNTLTYIVCYHLAKQKVKTVYKRYNAKILNS